MNAILPIWAFKDGKVTPLGWAAICVLAVIFVAALIPGDSSPVPATDLPRGSATSAVENPASSYQSAEERATGGGQNKAVLSTDNYTMITLPGVEGARNDGLIYASMLQALGVLELPIARGNGELISEVDGFPFRLGNIRMGDHVTSPAYPQSLCLQVPNDTRVARSVSVLISWPEGLVYPYISVQQFAVSGMYGSTNNVVKKTATFVLPQGGRDATVATSQHVAGFLYLSLESQTASVVGICFVIHSPDTYLYGATLEFWP